MIVQLLSVAGDHPLADNAKQPIAPRPTRPAALFRLAQRAERGTLGNIQLLFLGSMQVHGLGWSLAISTFAAIHWLCLLPYCARLPGFCTASKSSARRLCFDQCKRFSAFCAVLGFQFRRDHGTHIAL